MTPLSGPVLTAAEMRAAEDGVIAGGTLVETLMERAGAAVAEAVWRVGGGRPALILCGPGNNGGDGYVAARLLRARGLNVRVAALREPKAPAAINALQGWDGPVEALGDAAPAPLLVDALFGTGLARALEPEWAAPLLRLTQAARFTIAVDLPSGVGTDDGAALGAVPADLTLALGALKPCHLLQPAADLCGKLICADIGIAAQSATHFLERPQLLAPGASSHKYRRGYAVVVGGEMGGAAMLAAKAAMRLAGYVALVGARRTGPDALVHKRWEDVATDKRLGALLIGPGLGRGDVARAGLEAVLGSAKPLVIDADALMMIDPATVKAHPAPVILTPHHGEFDALFGKQPGSKIDRARDAAARSGATLIFKGADTVIASPGGRVTIAPAAPSWLASAGTGDVLAGIAAALLSSRMEAHDAACAAVWLHAEAARLAGPALIADDLPHHLPAALAVCL
jgi:ADP-dependent NAD(P)H-hydrate dehydratase / NAD(P)H-hydrate epimerase